MNDAAASTRPPAVLLGGGIGAGKSRIASVFGERGFVIIEADKVGHHVLDVGSRAVDMVASAWPGVVAHGVVDRQALARIVFSDAEALARLESITHPEIRWRISERIAAAPGPVVVEVPVMKVLADSSYLKVAVVADASVREDRAVARGSDRDDVRRRMANQPSDAQWREWADMVIDNTAEWDTTAVVVDALIDEVLADG